MRLMYCCAATATTAEESQMIEVVIPNPPKENLTMLAPLRRDLCGGRVRFKIRDSSRWARWCCGGFAFDC